MLLAGDLKDRAQRLQARQQSDVERARRKAEKDAILQQRARQRQQAHEAEIHRQRLDQLVAKEAAELHQDEIRERTGGVYWQGKLEATLIDESIALQRGIRRSADKVQLPASCGDDLMAQHATKNGLMYFELLTASGARTHASVLEFSAPPGTIALPQQTARSLFGPGASPHGTLQVTYTTLPKGTFARFQPATADFQKEIGADMEAVLEAALHARSSLSQGDWVDAQHAGRSYNLRVQHLEPESAVSVIDTEMEADVEPSVETEERLEKEQFEAAQRLARLEAAEAEEARRAAAAAEAAALEAAQKQRLREAKAEALPPEPSADGPEAVVACAVRLPDGKRLQRRFLQTGQLHLLFDWIDSIGAAGHDPGQYQLIAQFPRRVIQPADVSQSLAEAGLSSRQEALILEPFQPKAD